jgi:hypothetical protein
MRAKIHTANLYPYKIADLLRFKTFGNKFAIESLLTMAIFFGMAILWVSG